MVSRLRVLMTTDCVGGVFTYALELARALANQADIHLATMGPRPSENQRQAASALSNLTLHESDHDLEWMENPWPSVEHAGHWLLELDRRYRPDIVHLNGYVHGHLPFNAPVLVAAHSCVLSWLCQVNGVDVSKGLNPKLERYASAVKRGLHRAHAVVAPSRAMLRWLRELYGPLPPARVIYNGRSRLTFPATKGSFVLTAGRLWDAAKNLDLLSRAAPALAWPTYAAGPTEQSQDAEASAAAASPANPDPGQPELGELGKVHLLGALSPHKLGRWVARAPIFVLPARYEPFGLGPLEAAQAGAALVLGDIPTLREIWGGAAIFVDPDRPSELVDAVNSLIHYPDSLARHQALAQKRAACFPPEPMAAEYLTLYRELISPGRSACAS